NTGLYADKQLLTGWNSDPLVRALRYGAQAALINALGNESANVRMHAARLTEKQSEIGRNHRVKHRGVRFAARDVFECVLQSRQPGVTGMRTLDRLLELHLV